MTKPPTKMSTHELLVSIIGERKTLLLERALGAHYLRVPMTAAQKRARRDKRIVEALRHKTYRQVARQFRVDPRTVSRAAKRAGGTLRPLN